MNEVDFEEATYTIDVKDAASIEKKARRKYQGDLLQVKDVLRAQIVFPTEGSLICGLPFFTNLPRIPLTWYRRPKEEKTKLPQPQSLKS